MTTGVVLPVSVGGSATGWRLVDYVQRYATTDPAAGGLATLELQQLASDELWLIDHAVVTCSSTTETQCRWYLGAPIDVALIDGTAQGNFDVADWPAGLQVGPGQALVAQWAGASAGARGTLTLQGRVLRR